MKRGYARVSRKEQDLGRQIEALQQDGCKEIYHEKITGSGKDRPELERLKKEMQSGDVIVIQKLDRLGRSLKDLLNLVDEFKEKGIQLKSLTEGLDTTTAGGLMIFQIIGSIAQFEKSIIQERTKNGLAFKKANGVQLGRRDKSREAQFNRMDELINEGKTIEEICDSMNMKRATYYRILKLKNDEKKENN